MQGVEDDVERHLVTPLTHLGGILVLFGVVSFNRIGVDRFPEAEFPMLSVLTRLPGANPEIIDASITNTLEKAVNGVAGIEHVQSISAPGHSKPGFCLRCTVCSPSCWRSPPAALPTVSTTGC